VKGEATIELPTVGFDSGHRLGNDLRHEGT
jgi:hypothetical protein